MLFDCKLSEIHWIVSFIVLLLLVIKLNLIHLSSSGHILPPHSCPRCLWTGPWTWGTTIGYACDGCSRGRSSYGTGIWMGTHMSHYCRCRRKTGCHNFPICLHSPWWLSTTADHVCTECIRWILFHGKWKGTCTHLPWQFLPLSLCHNLRNFHRIAIWSSTRVSPENPPPYIPYTVCCCK